MKKYAVSYGALLAFFGCAGPPPQEEVTSSAHAMREDDEYMRYFQERGAEQVWSQLESLKTYPEKLDLNGSLRDLGTETQQEVLEKDVEFLLERDAAAAGGEGGFFRVWRCDSETPGAGASAQRPQLCAARSPAAWCHHRPAGR